jgi:hypothetical protein
MDSVSAVMTQVMREYRDSGPALTGPAAAKPHWGSKQTLNGHRLTHPPQPLHRLQPFMATETEQEDVCMVHESPHSPRPLLAILKHPLTPSSQGAHPSQGLLWVPQPHATPYYYYVILCLCFLFPGIVRSWSTDSTAYPNIFQLEVWTNADKDKDMGEIEVSRTLHHSPQRSDDTCEQRLFSLILRQGSLDEKLRPGDKVSIHSCHCYFIRVQDCSLRTSLRKIYKCNVPLCPWDGTSEVWEPTLSAFWAWRLWRGPSPLSPRRQMLSSCLKWSLQKELALHSCVCRNLNINVLSKLRNTCLNSKLNVTVSFLLLLNKIRSIRKEFHVLGES